MVIGGCADREGGVARSPVLLPPYAATLATFLIRLVEVYGRQGNVNVLLGGRTVDGVDCSDDLVGKLGLQLGESNVEYVVDKVKDDGGVIDFDMLVLKVKMDTNMVWEP